MRLAIITPALALRAGLRAFVASEEIEITHEAASLGDFDAQVRPGEVDVLLVTAQVVNEDRLRIILAAQEGGLAVLVLNDLASISLAQQVQVLARLPLRAWGILPVDASPEELQAALRAVHEGLVVTPPELFTSRVAHPWMVGEPLAEPLSEPLTERESQVLRLLAQGMANKQIALALGISDHTVKFHISSIYTKLGANSRTEAVRNGVQRGLVLL
jgi:two-component system, NarL family, response regulator YdfI